jgi:hypothetical protein
MSDDYQNAAKRHWHDAEILHNLAKPRLANASHLYGVSAECSLKVIARKHDLNKRFYGKGHMPTLFTELRNISNIGTNQLLTDALDKIEDDFDGWLIDQRYENENLPYFTAPSLMRQQNGAQNADLLANEVLGGRI